jgi:hypothetical protein
MALYNTVRFLEFVLDLGTVKRPLVASLCGVSIFIRAVCKLTMQQKIDFQHTNVSYKKEVMQSVSSQLIGKKDWYSMHSNYISPMITMKSKTCRSVLGQLQLNYVFPCRTRPRDWTIIKIRQN